MLLSLMLFVIFTFERKLNYPVPIDSPESSSLRKRVSFMQTSTVLNLNLIETPGIIKF